MKSVLSIDYLQLYCKRVVNTTAVEFTTITKPYQTKQFKVIEEYIFQNELFATVAHTPTSPIIPAHTHIVKISNRELYHPDLAHRVGEFLTKNGFEVLGITRIDLALDFQEFANKIDPPRMIDRFMKSKYLKVGRGKYHLIGEQKHAHTYDYLRFGSKTSPINIYLYNKSKEMKQVKEKPYIRDGWRAREFKEDTDVWRLEVSIKGSATKIVDLQTGELFNISLDILSNREHMSDVFYSLASIHFEFRHNDGQRNKNRMKAVNLLGGREQRYQLVKLPEQTNTTRADKILLKNIFQYDQERRVHEKKVKEALETIREHLIQNTGLQDYYLRKIESWQTDYPKI